MDSVNHPTGAARATTYRVTYERVGRHGANGSAPPPPLTVTAETPADLEDAVRRAARRYLGSHAVDVVADLDTGCGTIYCGIRIGGTFAVERELPHAPYILAVAEALTAAGLEPDEVEILDSEDNPYDDGPDTAACMLTGWITLDGEHPAVDGNRHPEGLMLIWEQPAGTWRWSPLRSPGVLVGEARWLDALPSFTAPDAMVGAVRALLVGDTPSGPLTPEWIGPEADEVRAACERWAADEVDADGWAAAAADEDGAR